MDQLELQPWPIRLTIDSKTVSVIGPKVASGSSEARHVWADDGTEYIAKSIGFKPRQSRYGPANELISALIGRELGVPLNEFGLLSHRNEMMFGSRWLPDQVRSYCSRDEQLDACQNREDVSKIVPFDVYVCNADRHSCNLVIKHQREARRPKNPILIADDHDRSLLPGDVTPEELSDYWGRIAPQQFVRSPVLQRAIRNGNELNAQVEAIENLSDEFIACVVRTVPDAWLSHLHRCIVRDFLIQRRNQVRRIVRELVLNCPNLRGGAFR